MENNNLILFNDEVEPNETSLNENLLLSEVRGNKYYFSLISKHHGNFTLNALTINRKPVLENVVSSDKGQISIEIIPPLKSGKVYEIRWVACAFTDIKKIGGFLIRNKQAKTIVIKNNFQKGSLWLSNPHNVKA